MFRKGGSAGEGITSGLAPRQGYEGGKTVEELNAKMSTYQMIFLT